jgi:hypothetical protein
MQVKIRLDPKSWEQLLDHLPRSSARVAVKNAPEVHLVRPQPQKVRIVTCNVLTATALLGCAAAHCPEALPEIWESVRLATPTKKRIPSPRRRRIIPSGTS